ncbi:LOW QUALITY PROTEIN: butyrophilin subfamily 1 member A1-like [Rhynochetos jubatus]
MSFPRTPGSLLSYLVTLHVLRPASADFRVQGPGYTLRASVGQDIVLPCHLSPPMDARSFEITWLREQFSETVHGYREGMDWNVGQLEEYAGRTELSRDGLSSGTLDLRITGLRPSDDGQYVCTVRGDGLYREAAMDLEVSATGSVPHLSLEAYEDGGIRVVCRSSGWYPEPEVLWKDPRGQQLPSVSQRRSSDEKGLVEIEDVIVVTRNGDGNRSCVVRNIRLAGLESSLHISAPFFHNAHPWMVALGVLLALSLVSFAFSASLLRSKALQSRELGKQTAALVWRKFLLPENPEVVTLDPDTAHPQLVLSADRRRVRRQSSQQDLPDTPKRFSNWCCVLGQEGFREGRHCWQVDIEVDWSRKRYSLCSFGVVRDSVKRKKFIERSPEGGMWCVWQSMGQFLALTSLRVPLGPVPRRVWVCLDYAQGLVTFLNADTGLEIFTFPPATCNGEIIRPWFRMDSENIQLCLRDSTS